jgi:L-2-hydroxyglutarate oxidase LhgO
MKDFEFIVVGGGVVGTAVARSLLQKKLSRHVAVLEKESSLAAHASGRNSGVLHSGFNLKPGSLKAKYCVEGNRRWRIFCDDHRVPYQMLGTIVLATSKKEQRTLVELLERGRSNGVPRVKILTHTQLKKREPHARVGEALYAPTGCLVDGTLMTEALGEDVKSSGGHIFLHAHVMGVHPTAQGYEITTTQQKFRGKWIINCAGLYADRIAHQMGVGQAYRVIPFRGDYYQMTRSKAHVLNGMIYPIPNLKYPFLGVHWTKTLKGETHVGPSAALAFGKESYHPLNVNLKESLGMLTSPHFRHLWKSASFRRLAWDQIKITLSRGEFIRRAQCLIPDVKPSDFRRIQSGNRAQLVHQSGKMVEDILVEKKDQSVHVLNAVSPGLTCALPFADFLVDLATHS